jgi:hypothetical protein
MKHQDYNISVRVSLNLTLRIFFLIPVAGKCIEWGTTNIDYRKTGVMGKYGIPHIPQYFYKTKEYEFNDAKDLDELVRQYYGHEIN